MLVGDWSEAPRLEGIGQNIAVIGDDRTWVVTLGSTQIDVAERTGDRVAATVAGDPSNVDVWLWGRASDDAIEATCSVGDVHLLRERSSWRPQ
jgi:hypothetical protein